LLLDGIFSRCILEAEPKIIVSRDNPLKPFSTLITSHRSGLVPGVLYVPHEVAD
jgi:hypothetical protein